MGIVLDRKRMRVWVDTSNVIYTAFFSCWKRYCEEFDVDTSLITPTYEIGDDQDFQRMFERSFKTIIEENAKKHTILFKWSDVYLAMDCKRDTIWRRSLLPTYKGDRAEKKKKYSPYQGSWTNMYKYINDIMIPCLVAEYGTKVLSVPTAECDDIIGVVVNRLKDSNNLVISSDHDYIQLGHNAIVVTPQGRNLTEEFPNSKVELVKKILAGDKSDCIPQIFTRHGPKSKGLDRLVEDKEYRQSKFDEDKTAKERYDFNRSLIDFNYVPKSIQKLIILEYQRVVDNA